MEDHQYHILLQGILVELEFQDRVDLDSMADLFEGIVAQKDNIGWYFLHRFIELWLRLWLKLCLKLCLKFPDWLMKLKKLMMW